MEIPPQIEEALDEISNGRYARAWELLNPLADAGDPFALCNVAYLYQFGFGVEANAPKAVEIYEAVGALGIRVGHLSAIAYHSLATLYIVGAPGFAPDREKAAYFADLAEQLGFPMS